MEAAEGKTGARATPGLGVLFIGLEAFGAKQTRPGKVDLEPGALDGVAAGRRAACRAERAPGRVARPRDAKGARFCQYRGRVGPLGRAFTWPDAVYGRRRRTVPPATLRGRGREKQSQGQNRNNSKFCIQFTKLNFLLSLGLKRKTDEYHFCLVFRDLQLLILALFSFEQRFVS